MTKIIAEVAQGYEGKLDYCLLYVRAAAKAGADAVKFQIVFADDVAEPGYVHYEWFKKVEMPLQDWQRARDLAKELGIAFFCDVSGDRALDLASQLSPDAIKFHASNFFNRALIARGYKHAPRVFISLGGIEEVEIAALAEDLATAGLRERTTFLYGFQAIPTPTEGSQLARIRVLKARFPGFSLGYLDHTDGGGDDRISISAMAVALDADWIEKHLTLSRHLEIVDCTSALEPDEFDAYIRAIERLVPAMGSTGLELDDLERDYRDKSVKKLLALDAIAAGTVLGPEHLAFKRSPRIEPFAGFHNPNTLVGRRLKISLDAGSPILEEHLD